MDHLSATLVIPALAVLLAILALQVLRATRARNRAEREVAFERELTGDLLAQAAALDRLVAALAGLAGDLDEQRVLEHVAEVACDLVTAEATLVLERDDGTGELRVLAAAPPGGWQPGELATESRETAAAALAERYRGVAHVTPLDAPSLREGALAVLRRGLAFTPLELAQLRVLVDVAARAAQSARLFTLAESLRGEAEERERERTRLSDRLLHVEEGERRRLALALHDGPQQTIAGIGLMLQAAGDALADRDLAAAAHAVDMSRRQARDVVRSLRSLTFALEPITLRDHGFSAACCELADQLSASHGLAIELDTAVLDLLDAQAQVCLYRITQEALVNAVKHAHGTQLSVTGRRDARGAVELAIADDGRGAQAAELERGGLHRGVDAMRERAWGVGGTLSFEPTPGGGTTVRVRVPPRAAAEPSPLLHDARDAA